MGPSVACMRLIMYIFRVFPPPPAPEEDAVGDIYEYLDPGWPHLSLVYQIALKVLERPDFDPEVFKKSLSLASSLLNK